LRAFSLIVVVYALMSSRVASEAKLMSTLRAENSIPAGEFPAFSRTGRGAWWGLG
jgi:hypothetical protein